MRAVIVNCFDTYEDRVDLVHEFFKKQNYKVTVIQSDFRHFKKVHRKDSKEDFIFVKSNPYYKNLSVDRLSSHYNYAKNAFKIVEDIKPDLLYVFIPPNSLSKFAADYKKKNENVKLIFDLIDLWPETMPIGKAKNIPPFTFWGAMRDRSLKYADLVITECDLYQSVLKGVLNDTNVKTVYLAKKNIDVINSPVISEGIIHLAYLGSINNIIDISKIKEIIYALKKHKPVTMHIIGDGESRQVLIEAVKSAGAEVQYYGKVYDPQEKQDIFDKCHFGLNIMKDSVCVGLTMKSIDYFQHGIPIINNIKADTTKIVAENDIGINITSENIEIASKWIAGIQLEELLDMKKRAFDIFNELFSEKAFEEKINLALKEIKEL